MDLLDLIQYPNQARRLTKIVRILVRYRLHDWLKPIQHQAIRERLDTRAKRAIREMPLPMRLRLALTEMGPTFIKLGQVLSTRPDLVGPEVANELRQLQADIPADPTDAVKRIVQDELGKPPEALFSEFEPTAFSSASIGQVHRARLQDGQSVIVKVQHDGIQEMVELDLDLLEGLAELAQEYVADLRAYQPIATVREFRRTLLRELDFSSERWHMEMFAKNFADNETVHIPAVYPKLCARRVLTMELMEGIPGSQPHRIRESGIDLNAFAKQAANIFLEMIFRDGFYHADPHPGNIMLMEGGALGLLDYGMVGHIDTPLQELFEDLILMLMQGDSEGLSDLLLRAGSAPVDVDRVAFRAEVNDLIIEYGMQSLEHFDIGGALDQMTGILRRHHILMPSSASLLLKTLIVLEGTSRLFSPTFDFQELLEPIRDRLVRERLDPRRWLTRLQRSFRHLDRLITNGPRDIADILDRLQAGRLTLRHSHQHLEVTANRLVGGLLIASLFLGSSVLLGVAFPPRLFGISVCGALGCLAAIVMGGRLLWAIRKDLR